MKTYTKPTATNANLSTKASSFGSGFMSAFHASLINSNEKNAVDAKSVKVTK